MLKVRALSALGRHSEALAESRQLTVEGVQSHPDALSVRAGTLYCAGNMQLAERVYQEVRPFTLTEVKSRSRGEFAGLLAL